MKDNKKDICFEELSKRKVKDMTVIELHKLIMGCIKKHDVIVIRFIV